MGNNLLFLERFLQIKVLEKLELLLFGTSKSVQPFRNYDEENA
jgi:hypothetical protein